MASMTTSSSTSATKITKTTTMTYHSSSHTWNVEAEKEKFRRFFQIVDTDGSGSLSFSEFSGMLLDNGYNLSEDQSKNMFRAVDLDGNESISLDEFTEVMGGVSETDHRRAMWRKAFIEYDKDGSGFIDREELRKVYEEVLGVERAKRENVDKVFDRYDTDKNNKISWEEFANYLSKV